MVINEFLMEYFWDFVGGDNVRFMSYFHESTHSVQIQSERREGLVGSLNTDWKHVCAGQPILSPLRAVLLPEVGKINRDRVVVCFFAINNRDAWKWHIMMVTLAVSVYLSSGATIESKLWCYYRSKGCFLVTLQDLVFHLLYNTGQKEQQRTLCESNEMSDVKHGHG